jgi:hypothetical protein
MAATEITLDQVLALAQRLRPVDQARLVVRLASKVERALEKAEPAIASPRVPLRGMLAHLGSAPSAEDIDEVQREMWVRWDREAP